MKSATALMERPSPTIGPERAELAQRIAARDAASERLEALRGAKAWERSVAARAAIQAATEALKEALEDDAAAATEALIAGAATPAPTAPLARVALAEAEAALIAAQATRTAIDEEIADIERGESSRANMLAVAAAKVVEAEATGAMVVLRAELDALAGAVMEKAAILEVLESAMPWTPGRTTGDALFIGVGALRQAGSSPVDRQAAAVWRAAIAKLKTDATAELPR